MPEDMTKRRNIYSYLAAVIAQIERTREDLLVMGDFNAVLHKEDRTGATDAADELQRQQVALLNLCPLGSALPGRDHTYHKAQGPNAPPCTSRIDDILLWQKPPNAPPMPEKTLETGGNLDHKSLVVNLPCPILPGSAPASPVPIEREPALSYPIKQSELAETKVKVASSVEIHDVWTLAREYKNTLLADLKCDHSARNVRRVSEDHRLSRDSHATVDRLGAALSSKLQEAHGIMMNTCTKAPPPSAPRFKRSDNKKFQDLLSQSKALKHFLRTAASTKDLESSIMNLSRTCPGIFHASSDTYDVSPSLPTVPAARELAHTKLTILIERMANMKSERTRRQREAARSNFQSRLAQQPKKTHRIIFSDPPNDDDPRAAFPEIAPGTAFHDGPADGAHICTDPKRVTQIVSDFFTDMFAPGHVTKTGTYLPADREPGSTYPWERPENPDHYKLSPPPGHVDPESSDLLELLLDEDTLRERIKHIGRSKSPGPDRLPNELIKSLPDIWHSAIHDMFVIMWITGRTPASWTESTTILLYKKGDRFLPQNYRPIGLAGALYKLWTSTVTYMTLHHCLRNNTLHVCQEGGILQRNTQRQLQNLMNAFDDARHFDNDLYVCYLDFSSAFNMVDHDQLLRSMYDMGIPRDVIEVVKDIYAGHRTSVTLPSGTTNPITVTRGTIQGDPLSPMLFLLYIEPLLRWLHVGGRGYKFSALGDGVDSEGRYLREVHQLAAMGFIDDTTCATNSRENLTIQLRKVEAFSHPTGFNLPVNNTKSAASAILYGTAKTYGGSPTDPTRLSRLLTGTNAVVMNGNPIPLSTPSKYLGILANPAMEWSHQLESVIKELVQKGRQLAASQASPRQCWRIIQTCLRPQITYTFGVVPYTMQEIGRLDRTLAGVVRRCCRLPRSMPTASILLSTEKAGMGLISLVVDYATIAAQTLTSAMNDTGRLGLITRALLLHQRKVMGGAPVDELPTGLAKNCTCLRKLTIMERHDLNLTVNGTPLTPHPTPATGTTPSRMAEDDERDTDHSSVEHLTRHPDGWFTRLLRHPGVSPAFMAPLLSLGIRHIGQLITANGTHIITPADLALLPGVQKVTNRHKQALNRLTVAVCGVLPYPEAKGPTELKTSDPLPIKCRTLPPGLSMPAAHTTRQGTEDIKKYLSRIPPPLVGDLALRARPPIPVQTVQKVSRKSLRASLQNTTHKLYAREEVNVGLGHMEASEVHDASPPGTLATFWQQRQELTANLRGSDPHVIHWRTIASDLTTRWEEFRKMVCYPSQHVIHLPMETLASLYDPQFTITAITAGPLTYKYEGKSMECYRVAWGTTVVLRHHLPMIEAAYGHASTSHHGILPTTTTIKDAHIACITTPCPPALGGTPSRAPEPALEFVSAEWQDIHYPKEHIKRTHPSLLAAYTAATHGHRPSPSAPPPSDTHPPA